MSESKVPEIVVGLVAGSAVVYGVNAHTEAAEYSYGAAAESARCIREVGELISNDTAAGVTCEIAELPERSEAFVRENGAGIVVGLFALSCASAYFKQRMRARRINIRFEDNSRVSGRAQNQDDPYKMGI